MSEVTESVELRYQEGSSDKVYRAGIVEPGECTADARRLKYKPAA